MRWEPDINNMPVRSRLVDFEDELDNDLARLAYKNPEAALQLQIVRLLKKLVETGGK